MNDKITLPRALIEELLDGFLDDRCTIAKALQAALDKPVEMHTVHTDCRSEEGITVGLVDTVINCARLLKQRAATPAVEQALQDLRADEDVATLLAEPVPPAGGEPEVYAYMVRKPNGSDHLDFENEYPSDAGYKISELIRREDHRAHVTRLQAEYSSLLGEHEDLIEKFNNQQAELTKALELLEHAEGVIPGGDDWQWLLDRIATFQSNQSAPVAKE